MRILHAGNADGGQGPAGRQSEADAGRNQARDQREPLPVHGLPADRRGDRAWRPRRRSALAGGDRDDGTNTDRTTAGCDTGAARGLAMPAVFRRALRARLSRRDRDSAVHPNDPKRQYPRRGRGGSKLESDGIELRHRVPGRAALRGGLHSSGHRRSDLDPQASPIRQRLRGGSRTEKADDRFSRARRPGGGRRRRPVRPRLRLRAPAQGDRRHAVRRARSIGRRSVQHDPALPLSRESDSARRGVGPRHRSGEGRRCERERGPAQRSR